MQNIYRFTRYAVVLGAMTLTSATIHGRASTQTPPAGTQSGQGTGAHGDGRATPAGTSGAQTAGQLNATDRAFLLDAIAGNNAEVALAKVAMQKASSASVKALARTIEQHHTEANSTLTAMAGSTAGAPAVKPAHKQLQDRLSKMEGTAFDQAYAAEMVKEHEKDVAKYNKASTQVRHSGLKAYVSETLPRLKQHLDMAKQASSSGSAR